MTSDRRTLIASLALSCLSVCAVPVTAQADEPPGERRGTINTESAWSGPMSQHVYLDAQTGVEAVQSQTFFANFNNVERRPAADVGRWLHDEAGSWLPARVSDAGPAGARRGL